MQTPPLVNAFDSAAPGEDVMVAVEGFHRGGFGYQRHMTTARLFMGNGGLNIIFGNLHTAMDDYASRYKVEQTDYRLNPPSQGSRCSPMDSSYRFIVSQPGVQFHEHNRIERHDWLVVNLANMPENISPNIPGKRGPEDRPKTIEERLEILKRLKDNNLITPEDYIDKKKQLLDAL